MCLAVSSTSQSCGGALGNDDDNAQTTTCNDIAIASSRVVSVVQLMQLISAHDHIIAHADTWTNNMWASFCRVAARIVAIVVQQCTLHDLIRC